MTTIGSAYVEIRALDKFFERDVRRIVKDIKDVNIKFKADVNMAPVYKKLRTLRASPLVKNTIVFNADVNTTDLYKRMEDVLTELEERSVTVNVDEKGLDPLQKKVEETSESLENTTRKLNESIEDATRNAAKGVESAFNKATDDIVSGTETRISKFMETLRRKFGGFQQELNNASTKTLGEYEESAARIGRAVQQVEADMARLNKTLESAGVGDASSLLNSDKDIKSLLDYTKKGSLEIHTIMKSQASLIRGSFIKAYRDAQEEGQNMEESMRTAMRSIEGMVENVRAGLRKAGFDKSEVEKVMSAFDLSDKSLRIHAEADTARAEAELAFLARQRKASIKAELAPDTVAAFRGAFHTITGTLPAAQIKSFFTGITANFEAVATKTGVVTTAIAGASAAILKFGGDAFLIADDIAQVVGIAAAGPAAIGMFGASIAALTLGWKNFSKAFSDDKAFKQLPAQAQQTVNAMRGMGTAIRVATQTSYWNAVGDSVRSFMKVVQGPLTKGLVGSGKAMGEQTKAFSNTLKSFTTSGGLATTFTNINKALTNATGAVAGFTKGFLELMEGGSKSLPTFGTWLSKIGAQFGDWAKKANESGKITEWIDQAVVRLQQLGSILKSTVGIFNAISDAARAAGLDGLEQLASGMQKVSAAMNSADFQTKLVTVFKSAKKAMENVAPGMGKFFGEIGDHVGEIGGLLETAGSSFGQFFTNLGVMLSRDKFWTGLQDLFSGVQGAMQRLEPGFARLGDALGNTFSIMGTVVEYMAPGLNQLFDTIALLTDALGPGIKAVIPVFSEFIEMVMTIVKSVIVPLATGIGNLMEAFAGLPGPIQTALMSLGAIPVAALLASTGIAKLVGVIATVATKVGLAKTAVSGFATVLGALATGKLGAAKAAFDGVVVAAGNAGKGVDKAGKQASGGITAIGTSAEKSAKKTSGAVNAAAKTVSGGKGGFFGKIFGGAAMGAVGGLPGILIGAGIGVVASVGGAIISSISEKNAEIKAQAETAARTIEQYKTSIDAKTGSLGSQSSSIASQALSESYAVIAGEQVKFADSAQQTGQEIDTVAKKLTSSIPAFKDYGKNWKDVKTNMQNIGDGQGALDAYTDSLRANMDAYQQTANNDAIQKQIGHVEELQKKWQNNEAGAGEYFRTVNKYSDGFIESLGYTVSEFDAMTQDQINSMSNGIAGQFDAITQAGTRSAQDIQKSYADAKLLAISENEKILNSSTSSAEEKLAAFQSNLVASGKTASAQIEQSAMQSQLAIQTISTEMKSMQESLKGAGVKDASSLISKGPDKNGIQSVLDYTKKGSMEVFNTMQSQAGTIQTAFVNAYDTAIKKNGDMDASMKTALQSVQPMLEGVKVGLKDAGFDKSEIDKIMASFNLDQESFEVGITADGTMAKVEALNTQQYLDAMANGDYKALISAEGGQAAQNQIAELIGLGHSFSNEQFEAEMRVEAAQAGIDFDTFMAKFMDAPDQKKFIAEMRTQGAEQATAEITAVTGKLNEADGKKVTSYLTTLAETGTLDDFNAKLEGLDGKTKQAVIQAILKGGTPEEITSRINAIPGTKDVIVEATDNTKGVVDGVTKTETKKVETELVPPKQSLAAMFTGMPEQKVSLVYGPMPPAPQIPDLKAKIKVSYGDMPTLKVPEPKAVKVKVSTEQGSLNSLKSAINGIKNKNVTVTAKASSGDVSGLKSKIDGIKAKSVTVTAKASSANVSSLSRAISGVKDKTVNVKANASAAQSTVKAVQGVKISDKSFSINGNNGGALAAIRAVNATPVSNKTMTITTIRRTIEQNNNGGFYVGGYQTFARGGFDPKIAKAIKRTRGQSENRVAQIARGSDNYRVWAEKETGGEAYIPLAKAKRARSLQILEQVARHFGLSIEKYANGGFNLGGNQVASGITTFASGGTTVKSAEKRVKKAQDRYNDIDRKKINKKRKEAAKKELEAAKKNLKAAQNREKESKKQADLTKKKNQEERAVLSSIGANLAAQFRPEKSPLNKEISGLRKEASKFISTYKKSRPKDAKQMEKVSKSLAKQGYASAGYTKLVNKYGGNKATEILANRAQKAQKTRSKKDDVLKGVTLRDYELAISRVENQLKTAESKLADLKSKKDQVVSGLASSISGEFKLNDLVSADSRSGLKVPVTAKSVSSYAKKKLSDIRGFKEKIRTLLNRGYDPALVQEIAEMGITDGTQVANALIKDNSQKKTLNDAYKSIQWNSKDLGQLVGNKMYDAGINAQKGLIKGLQADEKALKQAAAHLGDILYKEFKKKLGIKSPSRVMAGLGKFIPQGVALGIDNEKHVVSKSIKNLVNPKDLNVGSRTAGNAPGGNTPSNSGIMGGNAPQIIVNPSPGMNEVLVGQAASRELMYRLV